MEKIKLTDDEIKSLRDLRTESDSITIQLGTLEVQFEELKIVKSQILQRFQLLKQNQNTIGIALNQKYGEGAVDLDSGEFTKTN